MTLLSIADMLADVLGFEDIYAGFLDGNLSKAIGVYNSKRSKKQHICIGGKAFTKTLYKDITILLHWTDNPTQAEEQAHFMADKLADIRSYKHEGFRIQFIQADNPIWIGRDEKGICEYVINANIIYERNED